MGDASCQSCVRNTPLPLAFPPCMLSVCNFNILQCDSSAILLGPYVSLVDKWRRRAARTSGFCSLVHVKLYVAIEH
jgi:hypothetical protein